MSNLQKHLDDCHFDKYFKKLSKKLKGKSIIIYGAGALFQHIKKNYDLSNFNIIGISDNKYLNEQEGQEDLGYKIIPKEKLENYDADVVLLGVQNYVNILCDFASGIYKNKKTKIYPLVRIPLLTCLKEIWCK